MNFPWLKLVLGCVALVGVGAILRVGYGPGPEIEAEPLRKPAPCAEASQPQARRALAFVHVEPVELPVIESLPFERLTRIAYANIEADARIRCRADGGVELMWNCDDCLMVCFEKQSKHGAEVALWVENPP